MGAGGMFVCQPSLQGSLSLSALLETAVSAISTHFPSRLVQDSYTLLKLF